MVLNKPRPLKPGSKVRIVSPASPLSAEKLEFATNLLESEGYEVELGKFALAVENHLAGSDVERARDLLDAFLDPSVDMVYCSRGGYGCARLFPYIDLQKMAASGKLFAGFSDITTLHLPLNQLGLPTLHAPMPLTLTSPREPWVIASLLKAIKGENPILAESSRGVKVVGGVGQGVVTGGCMCLLTDSLGTPWPLQCAGKIVIIEDVDENPHRIDAMLTHLLNEGSIAKSAGIVIGEMTRTDERVDAGIGGKPWREIVRERLAPLGIPMIIDYPFGHAAQMLSLPLGIRAELNADEGTLTYMETLCAI